MSSNTHTHTHTHTHNYENNEFSLTNHYNNFYFVNKKKLNYIKNILNNNFPNYDIKVKNGLSTNLDQVFYNDNYQGKFIISAWKSSKGKETKLIFPYNEKGKLVDLKEIEKDNFDIWKILKQNYIKLTKRSLKNKNEWYSFARTQAINDINKEKVSISNLAKDIQTLNIKILKKGFGIYSGLYVISKTIDLNLLKHFLGSQDFIDFIKIVGDYKNGNWYTINSINVKKFLDYSYHSHLNNQAIFFEGVPS